MSICDEPKYTCGTTHEATSGVSKTTGLVVTGSRSIILTSGSLSIDLQKRTRNLSYADWDNYSLSDLTLLLISGDYYPCFSTPTTSFGADLSDSYKTTDTELQYLDLRYDTAVIKTIEDELTLDGNESTAPTDSVSVFTGYESVGYHPFLLNNIPIKETVTYTLITNGQTTELHLEEIHRGSQANLLMATFPTSPFGIRINTEWAKDVEWYRQDLRDTAELDGDRLLFYPEWCSVCGQMSQALDKLNASLRWYLNHGTAPETKTEGSPEVVTKLVFEGSVAYDRDRNIFYSLSVPETTLLTDPPYLLKQDLLVNGVSKEIPIEKATDLWYPIAPV